MIASDVKMVYYEHSPLNGAFTYLQKAFNRDNINDGIVKINASSTVQNLESPVVKRNIGTDSPWNSGNKNESWYEVDFLQNNFYLTSYVIRDHAQDFYSTFQVLGSNDGQRFDVVDDVTNFERPEGDAYYNILFKCKYPKRRKIFRIATKGTRFYGDHNFFIHRLEFYGVFNSRQFFKTCQRCNNMHYLSIWYISFLMIS